ncbi:hypothetical protein CDAR_71831 [Caerostris darwini]|uniref:BACK domain-containing protein n=1 Tax=Caerostris darwini TaxID=1538125 RepID=A0AAV4TH59_9ARAC|nr:hypothetical protein CDAR_71831 [Caerostris darwini]
MLTAYAAKKYLLPHLLRECFVFIEAHVSPKNVCQVYEFATVLEAHHLIYECLNIIDRQTHHVLTCTTFPSVSVSTLETIVGRPYLNIYSEFSLYSAVHLWAEGGMQEKKCRDRDGELEDSSGHCLAPCSVSCHDSRRVLQGPSQEWTSFER